MNVIRFCDLCRKFMCGCSGVLIVSLGLHAASISYTLPSPVLTPGLMISQPAHVHEGEQPHTEHHPDTRQVRELPKTSYATASTMVFRATIGPGPRFSGFYAGESSAMDAQG
jgi:hypothetical protein